MSIEQRLAELGITLPEPAAPVASYVPAVEANGLLHISGQISFAEDGSLIKGRLGEGLDLEAGRHARSAVGVPVLPLGVAVEVDAIVQVRG
jgi:enamine deaminase RidA (YjgF/YER057c/UK114 family)